MFNDCQALWSPIECKYYNLSNSSHCLSINNIGIWSNKLPYQPLCEHLGNAWLSKKGFSGTGAMYMWANKLSYHGVKPLPLNMDMKHSLMSTKCQGFADILKLHNWQAYITYYSVRFWNIWRSMMHFPQLIRMCSDHHCSMYPVSISRCMIRTS